MVEEWSPFLAHLDLSNNELKNLPLNAVAPAIRSLDLSCNLLHDVPDCICSFTTLQSLDLSDNPRIKSLPAEMGRLFHLSHLNLKGLKDLSDPPRGMQADCHDCIRYLNAKLRNKRSFYHMKLLLVGNANSGKTTLITYLRAVGNENRAMLIMDVSHWSYRPSFKEKNFHFNVWDFKGGEEHYTTQCFLSQNSLYLLLFNLKQGDKGLEELRSWLNSIALRAPHSCVIIVGTHLDEVPDEERGEVDTLLHHVGVLAQSYYNKLQIVETLPVGLKNRIENVSVLKEAIYKHAASYMNQMGQLIMGQKVPTSYHALYRHLQEIQHEVRQGVREPIMHAEAFRTMVHKMNLADIQDDEEIRTVTKFLVDVGSLLHYSNQGHHLNELYFIDPLWLWEFLSKFVKESKSLVNNGILSLEDFPTLFRDSQFPAQYSEQYLTLLKAFEIALSINSQQVLIPSMLPDKRPEMSQDEKPDRNTLLYSRLILFTSASTTPPGFWRHLLSRIIQSVPKVCHALEKLIPASNPTSKQSHDDEFKAGNEIRGETSVEDSPTSMSATAPSPLTTPQQVLIHSSDHGDSLNDKEVHLDYWQTGLYYRDSDVMFRIESLAGSKQRQEETKDGVLLTASNNTSSKKIICELVDLVGSVVDEWYPGLQEGSNGSNGLEQKVPCFKCIEDGRKKPFIFEERHWVSVVGKNDTIKCGYFHDDLDRNHSVSLADVVPDLLLQDIDPQFLLDTKEVEDDTSLLGEGDYGKVYRGQYRGRLVAIKRYLLDRGDAFTKLRSDTKALHQYQHPCFVSLVGVSIHPTMSLVLEQPPLESLEFLLLKQKVSIHRLTVFRITAEVAAALRFLHNRNIAFRDLSAANVLVWTLDPDSLCHVKLTNFDVVAHLGPTGARRLHGKKEFIAPEVLHITGVGAPHSSVAHKADIFSFGMLLYQLIAHKYPYYSVPLHEIDMAKESGEHPSLEDVYIAYTGYHYLTQIMKACWEGYRNYYRSKQPKDCPEMDAIIKKVCLLPAQMVMCVAPVNTSLEYLCHTLAITPSDYAKAGFFNRLDSELWVCCDGDVGAEINMTRTNTMVKVNTAFIKDNQIQCMALCCDHVWVASMAGIKYGSLDMFHIGSRELIHNIRMRENSTSCITSTDKRVYLGTREGYCFSFTANISEIQANARPRFKYVSEHGIDGIICTQHCVWVAHTKYIQLLNFDTLALEGSIQREQEQEACIGQLSFDPEHNVVWSAHIGGTILSAWNSSGKCHNYDIDARKHLNRIVSTVQEQHLFITAMTPALDTVWVGMASGHIMMFHKEDILTWFQPYEGYVRFLTYIPSAGPCEMEKAMVVSGGKDFKPLVEGLQEKQTDGGETQSVKGTLVMWEAYEAKTIRQMKLIESNAPDHLNDHSSVCQMIQQGKFSDGTLVLTGSVQTADPINSDTVQPEESDSVSLKVGNVQSENSNFSSTMSGDLGADSKVVATFVGGNLNHDVTDNHASVVPKR